MLTECVLLCRFTDVPENPIIHKDPDHFMNTYSHRVVQRLLAKHQPLRVLPANGKPLTKPEIQAFTQVCKDPMAASDELMGTFGPDPVSTKFQHLDTNCTACHLKHSSHWMPVVTEARRNQA